MHETANRIKELRSRRGFSQEELAERSGLSLRTIQRIENGETEPRGDSLTRLAAALDVTVDDLADWGTAEDNKFIAGMNLSALSFIVLPLLGIIVPLIVWIFKKDRIKGLNDAARRLLNFQITWNICFIIFLILWFTPIVTFGEVGDMREVTVADNKYTIVENGKITEEGTVSYPMEPSDYHKTITATVIPVSLIIPVGIYLFNMIMILVNTVRAGNGKKVVYQPAIPFIRK